MVRFHMTRDESHHMPHSLAYAALFFTAATLAAGCSRSGGTGRSAGPEYGGSEEYSRGLNGSGERAPAALPVFGYEVVQRYPHDARAYTQGLFIEDGVLYESTGRPQESSVRIVDLATGEVLRRTDLEPQLFGEGIAPYKGLLVMLTWKAGTAIYYSRNRLTEQYRKTYTGEGWGLTTDGERFWMSDGVTPELRIIEPSTFEEQRRLTVLEGTRKVYNLNELEWIDGAIWANIWQKDRIARIDPKTGQVTAWLDLTGLLGTHRVADPADEVLNGIAWDAAQRKLYVTGKRWPWLYEIKVLDRRGGGVIDVLAAPPD